MKTATDWTDTAAREIEEDAGEPRPNGDYTPGFIKGVIAKHSPFHDGVAYMLVPRCETCKYWCPHAPSVQEATCVGPTLADTIVGRNFGCVQWKEKE